jgi:tRNA(His) 5'-end guanylyltransferase
MSKDSLGDRMKRYERVSDINLMKRTPVIIRVDGKAFHTLTRGAKKPFDPSIMSAMVSASKAVAASIQGFKLAYVQSDEATFLLTDTDDIHTDAWFDNRLSKLISVTAALMSVYFNLHYDKNTQAVFDARAFNVPLSDVANNFLWRAQDWGRNSLQMYCQSIFSHKELHSKNKVDLHNMLHKEGRNWTTDLSPQERNGTFIYRDGEGLSTNTSILPTYENINNALLTLGIH